MTACNVPGRSGREERPEFSFSIPSLRPQRIQRRDARRPSSWKISSNRRSADENGRRNDQNERIENLHADEAPSQNKSQTDREGKADRQTCNGCPGSIAKHEPQDIFRARPKSDANPDL